MQVAFLPLDGVRVIDVTTSLAGPVLHRGARRARRGRRQGRAAVGDEARTWGPPFWGDESAMFLAMNAGKRSLALDLRRGTDVLLRLADWRRRVPPEPQAGPCRGARLRAGCAARTEPPARVRHDRRLRPHGPVERAAGLRPARAGGGRHPLGDGRARTAGRARRRLARRPGHGHVGGARRARRAHGARANRRGQHGRRLALRDGDRVHGVPPHRLPRLGSRARENGHRLPVDRAVPGVRYGGRRADGRGRERPPVRRALRGAGRAGARRRRAVRDEPAARRAPRCARLAPRRSLRHEEHGRVALGARGGGRAGRARPERGAGRRGGADGRARHPPGARRRPHPGAPPLGGSGAHRCTAHRLPRSGPTPRRSSPRPATREPEIDDLVAAGIVRLAS